MCLERIFIQIRFLQYKYLKHYGFNTVYVQNIKVSDTNHPALYFDEFEIEKPYWICEEKEDMVNKEGGTILDDSYEFKFQNRHIQTPLVYLRKDDNCRYWVKTKNYFRAIVTGQVIIKTKINFKEITNSFLKVFGVL